MSSERRTIPACQVKVGDRICGRTVRSAWLEERGVRVLYWDDPEPVYLDAEQPVTVERQQA